MNIRWVVLPHGFSTTDSLWLISGWNYPPLRGQCGLRSCLPQWSMIAASIFRYAHLPPRSRALNTHCRRYWLSVHWQPSPPEKQSFWRRYPGATRSSNHRNLVNENEPFSISRESFDSYRRSFVGSPRSALLSHSISGTDRGTGYFRSFPHQSGRRTLSHLTRLPLCSHDLAICRQWELLSAAAVHGGGAFRRRRT